MLEAITLAWPPAPQTTIFPISALACTDAIVHSVLAVGRPPPPDEGPGAAQQRDELVQIKRAGEIDHPAAARQLDDAGAGAPIGLGAAAAQDGLQAARVELRDERREVLERPLLVAHQRRHMDDD